MDPVIACPKASRALADFRCVSLRLIVGGHGQPQTETAHKVGEAPVLTSTDNDERNDSTEEARALLLSMAIKRLDLEEPIDATLPRVARDVARLCSDPDASIQQLSRLLETDPGMAAHAIVMANSAFHRGRFGAVEQVSDAVLRLGAQGIRTAILAPRIRSRLVSDPISRALWSHSTAVASVTPFVAALAKIPVEGAHLAGLLHDIGRMLLWMDARSLQAHFTPQALREAADELHEEIGQTLLERWQMPEPVILAVGQHHQPPFVPVTEAELIAHAVCIADGLVGHAERGETPDLEEFPSIAALNLKVQHIEALWTRIPAMLEEAQEI